MLKIFVFGSNLAGRHGAGSAKYALTLGAIYGRGVGPQGLTYAIPTKDYNLIPMPLSEIEKHVKDFLKYAASKPEHQFEVVKIGCGLAGFKPEQIAPMFEGYGSNINLPKEFLKCLNTEKNHS